MCRHWMANGNNRRWGGEPCSRRASGASSALAQWYWHAWKNKHTKLIVEETRHKSQGGWARKCGGEWVVITPSYMTLFLSGLTSALLRWGPQYRTHMNLPLKWRILPFSFSLIARNPDWNFILWRAQILVKKIMYPSLWMSWESCVPVGATILGQLAWRRNMIWWQQC